MISKKIVALLLSASFSSHSNAAGYDVQKYQSFRGLDSTQKEMYITYLIGVSRGVIVTNIYIEKKTGVKLFCIPDNKFDEAYGAAIQALNSEIASPASGHPYEPDAPMEIVMLNALKAYYPCAD